MQTARFGHGLPLRLVGTSVALLGLMPLPGQAAGAFVTLSARHPQSYRVTVRRPTSFSVSVPADAAVDVRIQQRKNGIELMLRSSGSRPVTPRYCPGGAGCVLHATLLGRAHGPVRFTLRAFAPGRPASGVIEVSRPRPVSAALRQRVRGERLLARAEWAQRSSVAKGWTQANADFSAAVRIARRSGDPWLLRTALTNQTRLDVFQLGHYRSALALGRAAVRQAYGTDWADEAFAWQALAAAYSYRARNGEAIAAQRRALALQQRAGNRFEQDVILGNLAYEYFETGRTSAALRSARASFVIARSIGDGEGVDFDLEALAEFHRARGDFNRAFIDFQRALSAMHRVPYPDRQAAAWDGLGEMYDTLGDRANAAAALHRAVQIAAAAHDGGVLLDTRINLADLKRQEGDLGAALAYDQRSLARAVAMGLPREESFLLLGLGRDEMDLGHLRRAGTAFRRAIALAARIDQPDSEATAWLALGDEQSRAGQRTDARADYLHALALAQRRFGPLTAASATASLARLDWRAGHLQHARRRIDAAVRLLGSLRSTVTTERLRTEYFASAHGYYSLGVSILMSLQRRHPGAGYTRLAIRMVERARARSLLDELQGANRLNSALLPAGLARQLQGNRARLEVAYTDWRDLLADPHASPRRFAQLRSRIQALRRTRHRLEALARGRSLRYAALSEAHPVQLSVLQQRVLKPHAALLEYWVGRRRGYAWLIRRRSITTVPLAGAQVLAPRVRALYRALTARSHSIAGESLEQRARRIEAADAQRDTLERSLGAQLLPSARQLQSLDALYIVADGPLFGMPFAVLHAAGARHALIDSMTLREEPSASVLAALQHAHRANRSGRIEVFADPVYRRPDQHAPKSAAAAATSPAQQIWDPLAMLAQVRQLPASRAEAMMIARLSGTRAAVHLGYSATVRAVRQVNWRQVTVAHFAVHTLLDALHPSLSGLVLSLWHRNGTPAPAVLWMHQIESLAMPVDLVVLSSCRTISGRAVPGEGLDGIFRAFLLAGTHAVLGTLWRVQDQATAHFMRTFYRALLRRHLPPAEALQVAQKRMQHSARYHAPYYWAGFSLEGYGEVVR